MYKLIMVPVDLAHAEKLEKALTTASDLAKHYGARMTYVAVTSNLPSSVAHNPKEYAAKLTAFAEGRGRAAGIEITSKAITLHDPAAEMDHALVETSNEMGADLVVMASHIPGAADHIWPSHGGRLAAHARASVFVVRPD